MTLTTGSPSTKDVGKNRSNSKSNLQIPANNSSTSIETLSNFGKSKKIDHSKKRRFVVSRPKPPSLQNIGANCYLNSALQGIASCDKFIDGITNLYNRWPKFAHDFQKLKTFESLIKILSGKVKGNNNRRIEISRNPIFRNWNKPGQQDSFELMCHMVNEVYNEIRQILIKNSKIEEGIQAWLKVEMPMRIILQYRITCACEKNVDTPLQSDLALHVPIKYRGKSESNNLEELLDNFFKNDHIDEYECDIESCDGTKAGRHVRLVEPLPQTLCIHLQRSYWAGWGMHKIESRVNFTEELCIRRGFILDTTKSLEQKIGYMTESTPIYKKEKSTAHENKREILHSKGKQSKKRKDIQRSVELDSNDKKASTREGKTAKVRNDNTSSSSVDSYSPTSNSHKNTKGDMQEVGDKIIDKKSEQGQKINKLDKQNKCSNKAETSKNDNQKDNNKHQHIEEGEEYENNNNAKNRATPDRKKIFNIKKSEVYSNNENENTRKVENDNTSNSYVDSSSPTSNSHKTNSGVNDVGQKKCEVEQIIKCESIEEQRKDRNKAMGSKIKSNSQKDLDIVYTYKLTSVIVHYGSLDGGHYVCYRRAGSVWFLTDDSQVNWVNSENVMRVEPYILFYEQS